jgi:hypothetical protein
MHLMTVGKTRVRLSRWNNLGGAPRVKRWGPMSFYRHDTKWQLIIALRPFKVGRRSLYLKLAHGYQ